MTYHCVVSWFYVLAFLRCMQHCFSLISFQRPGGALVDLRPEELPQAREASVRHARCDFLVLDARSEDFEEAWRRNINKPVLFTNLVDSWPALHKWNAEWFAKFGQRNRPPLGLTPWNFSAEQSPQNPSDKVHLAWSASKYQPLHKYFELWNAKDLEKSSDSTTIFREPNSVIFSSSDERGCTRWPAVSKDTPWPNVFKNLCNNRHVAFTALFNSHGFHRHGPAWQGQVAGFKSWYVLPHGVFTEPTDVTTAREPYGFPFEPHTQEANSMCGYVPAEEEIRRNLHFCVQGPGEVVFVPDHWWHGTCALDEFSAGSGGGLVLEGIEGYIHVRGDDDEEETEL